MVTMDVFEPVVWRAIVHTYKHNVWRSDNPLNTVTTFSDFLECTDVGSNGRAARPRFLSQETVTIRVVPEFVLITTCINLGDPVLPVIIDGNQVRGWITLFRDVAVSIVRQ
jgi:hypothetical protein